MAVDFTWPDRLGLDVTFGYVDRTAESPRELNPTVVLNSPTTSMLRTIREELRHCSSFAFSVAFVSPRAIALLKQELIDFRGTGQIVTSDYLGFNSPQAFSELLKLRDLGIDSRLHSESAYHPKGYIFGYPDGVTAVLGSSNLTEGALAKNLEWNLKVSATQSSDLAVQLDGLVRSQLLESSPLTQSWIDDYASTYVMPPSRHRRARGPSSRPSPTYGAAVGSTEIKVGVPDPELITPNAMQEKALEAIAEVRISGETRAVVISATGTGKTMLSALDVRNVNPDRVLFIVHREQILDRAIAEFKRVIRGEDEDFGKLTGSLKELDKKYTFATIQTLSRPGLLEGIAADAFDYILIDEVHRAGAASYMRVIEHFTPAFLLGMTATPDRTDGFNVFELFDYNVPYEIRLAGALEADMLSPFHYYGVADYIFGDGQVVSDATAIDRLTSRFRVDHLLDALDLYAQSGVAPRGLIFCSRAGEAHRLSVELNERFFRGELLRTVALTGDDPIEYREHVVEMLESGHLDYVLTVDIFNEGVDIPSINQVVMLRQTQSSIVFVQQLGRGLRKHPGKDYLVVIDFIGNYANNYLIPTALFGDASLDKESLRKNLIAAEEAGVLPGLSSVRFDRVAQELVLRSVSDTKFDSASNLKIAITTLRNRLGAFPRLWDFWRFGSVDPILLAQKFGTYPELLSRYFGVETGLSVDQLRALSLLSYEALDAKRPHELLILREVLAVGGISRGRARELLEDSGVSATPAAVNSAVRSMNLEFNTESERAKYGRAVLEWDEDRIVAEAQFRSDYANVESFAAAVDDVVETGIALIGDRYEPGLSFTPGRQYSRKDVCRQLLWQKNVYSTIYGYKVDRLTATCPIFVTHHKSSDVSASTAYQDELLDRTTMKWFSRSRRSLESAELEPILRNEVALHAFAKQDDAEGSDFYYLGQAISYDPKQTTMPGANGEPLSVVEMRLRFDQAIQGSVYDYFHPTISM